MRRTRWRRIGDFRGRRGFFERRVAGLRVLFLGWLPWVGKVCQREKYCAAVWLSLPELKLWLSRHLPAWGSDSSNCVL
jgi:hypothetical protein